MARWNRDTCHQMRWYWHSKYRGLSTRSRNQPIVCIAAHHLLSLTQFNVNLNMTKKKNIHYKVWDEITYALPNFIGCTVEVWEWISNLIQHFAEHVISYPCWDRGSLIHYQMSRGTYVRKIHFKIKTFFFTNMRLEYSKTHAFVFACAAFHGLHFTSIITCGMHLLIHSQTSVASLLKFGNG